MASVIYTNETHRWHAQLTAWVDSIMACIIPLSEGLPQASATIVEKSRQVQFGLRVEWCDELLHEVMIETFTCEHDK